MIYYVFILCLCVNTEDPGCRARDRFRVYGIKARIVGGMARRARNCECVGGMLVMLVCGYMFYFTSHLNRFSVDI